MKQLNPTYQQLLTEVREAYEDCVTNENLDITGCVLNLDEMRPLLSLLIHPDCKITSLILHDNDIGPEVSTVLANVLQNPHCKISSLDLYKSNIGKVGAIALATALQNPHCKITEIDLLQNNIETEGAIALANALQSEHCKLNKISLIDNNIGPEGAIAFARALRSKHCKTTSLNLGDNCIKTEGAKALAAALQSEHCKLTSLDLNSNYTGPEGAIIFANVLQLPHCGLTSLDLSGNRIGSEGATALANALQNPHCKITELNLGWNKIGTEGIMALASALQSEHCKITELNLEANEIGDDGVIALANALHHPNCNLPSLDLNENKIGAKGAIALANALKSEHCKITSLNLYDNDIGPEGAIALATVLQSEHCKITSLDLGSNNIGYGAASIYELIEQNEQIQRLSKNTYHLPILDAGYSGGGESKNTDEPLPQPTLSPEDLSEMALLITARAKTLNDIFEVHVSTVDSGGASKENQDAQITPQVLTWVQYVYTWIWKNSRPCYRTAEIFKACYEIAPNTSIFQRKNSSSTVHLTFLEQVLHQELSALMITNEVSDDESLRTMSLFETMIQLDIDTFMRVISDHYRGFLPQSLNIIYQLLEKNTEFRPSPNGLKAFQYFVTVPKHQSDKIKLDEFRKVSSWALDYIKNNPLNMNIIKKNIRPYVAKFFKDYYDTVVTPDEDPMTLIKSKLSLFSKRSSGSVEEPVTKKRRPNGPSSGS